MTTVADIFKDANIRSSLTQFTDAHLDRLETSLFEKSGKPALKCLPQLIFKWSQDGSNYPRFDEKELLNLHVPDAVAEIGNEDSEAAALAYLRTFLPES